MGHPGEPAAPAQRPATDSGDPLFVPTRDDVDPQAEATMVMGRGPENDLRDPWFHTEEGQRWLAETEAAAGPPGIAGF